MILIMNLKSIHLILDTNIFRNDIFFKKAEFKALERLLESGQITLHVPYIVFNEFITYQISKYEEIKLHFDKSVNDLKRFGFISKESKETMEQILLIDYKEEINKNFKNQLSKYKAKIYNHIDCDPMDILKDYFDGAGAFKTLKNKEDIPDSFLHHFLLDFITKHMKKVYFISNDSHLRKTLESNNKLITHSSLKEFIESNPIKGCLSDVDYTTKVTKFLKDEKSEICYYISNNIVDMLSGKQIEDPRIPSDDNIAYISSVSEIVSEDDITLDLKTLHYYGDNQFVMDCEFITTVEGYVDVFKPDYIAEEMNFSVFEESDHYFTSSVEIQIRIKCGMQFKMQYLPKEDKEQLEFESASIDSINKIEVLDIN